MSYLKHKKGSLEEAILETVKIKSEDNTNDKSDDGDGLDKVQPKAVKKKFKDRKDKDIDNDGDVDDSDKFLHKRRKAISKAIEKEGNKFTMALKQARANGDKEMVVGNKKYPVKEVIEAIKSKYRPEETDAYFKVDSMRDALMKVWERAVPKEDAHKDDEEPKKKNGKTMTGKKVDDVKVNMPEKKVGKKDLPQ